MAVLLKGLDVQTRKMIVTVYKGVNPQLSELKATLQSYDSNKEVKKEEFVFGAEGRSDRGRKDFQN